MSVPGSLFSLNFNPEGVRSTAFCVKIERNGMAETQCMSILRANPQHPRNPRAISQERAVHCKLPTAYCPLPTAYCSSNSNDRPYVSGNQTAEASASAQTIRPVRMSPSVSDSPKPRSSDWCKGIRSVTAPRMKLVTVAVTVTRRLVPNCSEVLVTKTDK